MGKTSRFKVLCSSRGFKLVSFFVNGICKDSFTLGFDGLHQVIFNFGSSPILWPQWNYTRLYWLKIMPL